MQVDTTLSNREIENRMLEASQELKRKENTRLIGELIAKELRSICKSHKTEDLPFQLFLSLQEDLPKLQSFDLSVYPESLDTFQKYVVYSHSEEGMPPFSLTLMVFAPGQSTPKHSHKVDCAPICLRGMIHEARYVEREGEKGQSNYLEPLGVSSYKPSEGGYLSQNQPNIHALENRGHEVAMSLHLYLFDANCGEKDATSVLKVY